MFLLLESVRIVDGCWMNVEYHQRRMLESAKELFGVAFCLNIAEIDIPVGYQKGVVKARVVYDTAVREIGFDYYVPRKIESLQLVYNDQIDYHLKFADRSALNELVKAKGDADEVLIVKNGFITDISYANIVVRYKDRLVTPEHCLLKGTCRQLLLDQGLVVEEPVDVDTLFTAQSVFIVNAMLGLEDKIEIPVDRIFR